MNEKKGRDDRDKNSKVVVKREGGGALLPGAFIYHFCPQHNFSMGLT